MKLIACCSIILITSKLMESYVYICDKEYCLWTDENVVNLTSIQQARDQCPNGWLLEIYGPSVWRLTLQIFGAPNVVSEQVFLNMEKGSNWWIWNNKTDARIPITSQDDNPVPLAGSLRLTYQLSGALTIAYLETEINTQLFQICSKKVLKEQDCSFSKSWLINETCYYVSSNLATWFEANNNCINSGATLAVFDDPEKINVTVLFPILNERYWVGLSRNSWKWSHADAVVTFNRWMDNYLPYRECAYLKMFERGYFWKTSDCNGPFIIICMTYFNLFSINASVMQPTLVVTNSLPVSTAKETTLQTTGSPSKSPSNYDYQLVILAVGWAMAGLFLLCLIVVVLLLWKRPGKISRAKPLPFPDKPTSDVQPSARTSVYASDYYNMSSIEDAKLEAQRRMYGQLEN